MKYLAAAIFLFTPLTAFASTQQIILGNVGAGNVNTSAGVTGPMGTAVTNNSGIRGGTMPVPGTFSNLYFHRSVPTGTGTNTITLNVSAATALTCTIPAGSSDCSDLVHAATANAGDAVSIGWGLTAGNPASEGSWSVVFTPTNDGDTILIGGTQNNGSAGRGWMGPGISSVTSDTASRGILPTSGTLDTLYTAQSAFTSGTYEFTAFVNNASTTIDCTQTGSGSASTCTDFINSSAISAGDTVSVGQLPNAPGGASRVGWGLRFVPTTRGDFPIFGGSGASTADTAGATRYNRVSGNQIGNANEASTTQIVGTPMTITKMYVLWNGAPGTGKTATTTLRVNGADTLMTCTVAGNAATACNSTQNISLLSGDLIDVSVALTSGGNAGNLKVAFLATTQPAATTVTHGLVRVMNSLVRIMNGTVIIY